MKLIFVSLLFSLLSLPVGTGAGGSSNPISDDGFYKGIRLSGRVQFVEHGEDFRIQIVDASPHLNVRYVRSAFMNRHIGEWQRVDRNPDFKVKVVNAWPDFRVRIVNSFPGVQR